MQNRSTNTNTLPLSIFRQTPPSAVSRLQRNPIKFTSSKREKTILFREQWPAWKDCIGCSPAPEALSATRRPTHLHLIHPSKSTSRLSPFSRCSNTVNLGFLSFTSCVVILLQFEAFLLSIDSIRGLCGVVIAVFR